VTDSNFDETIKQGLVLVISGAPWCGPCRMLAPTVDALADDFNGRATVAKMAYRREPAVPSRFAIRGIPTLLLFKEGEVAGNGGGRQVEGGPGQDDRETSLMSDRQVVIIGSGPAGLTAALYAARARTSSRLLVEGLEAGGQLMLTTNGRELAGLSRRYHGPDLMGEMRAQAERFGAEIIQGNVTSVTLASRPFTVALSDGRTFAAGLR
jgi:alkyl hydroperoxide reductase subunit AhpF